MILEITENEFKIISRSVELYEAEPMQSGMMSSMIKSMLIRDGTPEDREAAAKRELDKADEVMRQRKLETARLRVKLLEAMERPSEFSR